MMSGTEPQRMLDGGAAAVARVERIMQRRQKDTETLRRLWNDGEIAKANLPCHDACNGEIRVHLPMDVVERNSVENSTLMAFCPMHMVEGVCPLVTLKDRQLTARMRHANFGVRYLNPDAERIRARQTVEQYLGNVERNVAEGRGLVFSGDVGVGKTMTLAYMARRMLSSNIGVWKVLFPEFIDDLQDRTRKQALVERALKVEVLMIDDFGSGDVAPWIIGVLEAIVENRYARMSPVIVSTNMTQAALEDDQSPFRRMVDRWRETSAMVKIGGTSQRTGDA